MRAQQWGETHTDPYHPRTHAVLFSHTDNLLTHHCDGIPLSPSVTRGYCGSDACSGGVGRKERVIDTSPECHKKMTLSSAVGRRARGSRGAFEYERTVVRSRPRSRPLRFSDSRASPWRPCSHLAQQPLEGVSGWQCLGFILGTWLLFILAHSR